MFRKIKILGQKYEPLNKINEYLTFVFDIIMHLNLGMYRPTPSSFGRPFRKTLYASLKMQVNFSGISWPSLMLLMLPRGMVMTMQSSGLNVVYRIFLSIEENIVT